MKEEEIDLSRCDDTGFTEGLEYNSAIEEIAKKHEEYMKGII